MARRWPFTLRRGLRAAGVRVQIENREVAQSEARRRQKWQAEAWSDYDTVPWIQYPANFVGWQLRRLRLLPGLRMPDGRIEPNPDDASVRQAIDELNVGHGHADILDALGVSFVISGEGYLVGEQEAPRGDDAPELDPGAEKRWGFYSTDELRATSDGKWKIAEDGDRDGRELDPERSVVLRLWVPHKKRRALPYSPMLSLLDAAEEYLIWGRHTRAVGRSRIASGEILVVASQLSHGMLDATLENHDGGTKNPSAPKALPERLTEHFTTPVSNEGVAAAIAPFVLEGDAKYITPDLLRFIAPTRKIDELAIQREQAAIATIAAGMPLPPEVIKGSEGLSHWTIWGVTANTWDQHLKPFANRAVESLTQAYLHPWLEAMNEDPGNRVIWYDASEITAPLVSGEDADKAHDRITISDSYYRQVRGIPESAAPEEDEIRRRMAQNRGPLTTGQTAIILQTGGEEIPEDAPGTTTSTGGESTDPGEEPPATGGPEGQVAAHQNGHKPAGVALLAAAPARGGAQLGRQLSAIDRQLADRILTASDNAIRRGLERAGSHILSRTRKDQAVAAAARGVNVARVCQTLGPAICASYEPEERLDAEIQNLRGRFYSWTRKAYKDALRLFGFDADPVLARADRSIEEGWNMLRVSLGDIARSVLYAGDPAAPSVGEFDATLLVQYGQARQSLALAGGSVGVILTPDGGVFEADGTPAGGIATGAELMGEFRAGGGEREGWLWEYGAFPRQHPFEPHMRLDGLEFESFDDERLANSEGWPSTDFFVAGDHAGCACTNPPILIMPDGSSEPDA